MFSVCSQCHRHVRLEDERCPFCGLAQRNQGGTPTGALLAVALGAAVAIGCGGETESTTVPVYGAPPQGGSANRGGATSYPSGGLMVPYGLPPTGGMSAIYAGPPRGGAGGKASTNGGNTASTAGGTQGGAGGKASTSGGNAGSAGSATQSGAAGKASTSGGNTSAGGSLNRGGAATYPSGGIMPPYGLPPTGGVSAVPVYGAPPQGGSTSTGSATK